MDVLRSFIEADTLSAVDVGHLRKGIRPFFFWSRSRISVTLSPEAAIRGGADELTLRAEEVGTLEACINVDHTEFERGGPPMVDTDWHAFCRAKYMGIEGDEWRELYCHYREMSRAIGAKTPSELKAKSPLGNESSQGQEGGYYDPARQDNILGMEQDTSGALGRAPQRPNHSLGQSVEVLGEFLPELAFGSKRFVESRLNCDGL